MFLNPKVIFTDCAKQLMTVTITELSSGYDTRYIYLSDDKDDRMNYIVSQTLQREAEGKTASTSIRTEWRGLQPTVVWAT
jgi:hypothetical protein